MYTVPTGFSFVPPPGPAIAGGRERKRRAGRGARAGRHGGGDLRTDGAVLGDEPRIDPERRLLRLIGIGHKAREKHRGRARHIRDPVRHEAAGTRLRHRERRAARGERFHDDALERGRIGRDDMRRERALHDGRRLRELRLGSDDPQIDLARPRAVAELEAEREQRLADQLLHARLAEARDPPGAHAGFARRRQRAEDRHGRGLEHRLQLARRTGQQEEMRRLRARREVEPGRGAELIRQHHRLRRPLRLPRDPCAHRQAAPREPLRDRLHHLLIVDQRQPQQFRRDLPRDVIRRRPESAGDDHDLRAREALEQRAANVGAIGHRHLAIHPQPEWKERLRQEAEMSIEHAAKQQFGAGIDDFNAHRHGGTCSL